MIELKSSTSMFSVMVTLEAIHGRDRSQYNMGHSGLHLTVVSWRSFAQYDKIDSALT
jgi:hypothetical protein